MIKPTAPCALNPWTPRSDRVDICFGFDENTGSALTQLAGARLATGGNGLIFSHSAGVGTPITSAWATDSYGRYIDFNNSGTAAAARIWNNTTGVDVTMPRGGFQKIFRIGTDGGTAAKTFMRSSTANGNTTFRLTRAASSSDLVAIIENGASDYTYTFAGASNTALHNMLLIWGEDGYYAWLNGVLGTPTNNPSSYTGGILTSAGAYWNMATGTNPGLHKVYGFARWNYQLEAAHLERLRADQFNTTRELPASRFPCVVAIPGTALATSMDMQVVAAKSGFTETQWRVLEAATVDGFDSPTATHGPWTVSTAERENRQRLTGLSAASRAPVLPQWSPDGGTTWYPFAFGLQWAITKDYVNPLTGFAEELEIPDDHEHANADGGAQIGTYAQGDDIFLERTSALPYPTTYEGQRKRLNVWLFEEGIYTSRKPSFTSWMGDDFYFDAAGGADVAAIATKMHAMGVAHINHHAMTLSLGPAYRIRGNHERTGPAWLMDGSSNLVVPRAALAERYFRIFTCNPGPTDYTEGGETGTGAERLPPLGVVPAAFVAGETLQVGDIRRPTGTDDHSKTRAYIADVGGVAGSDDSATWTRQVGATFTSGAVTFRCIWRWDADTKSVFWNDPDGYTDSPYRNYFAFTWAGSLHVYLDVTGYSRLGTNGSEANRTGAVSMAAYTLGTTQPDWYEGVLEASTATLKFIKIHHTPGGDLCGPNGTITDETKNYSRIAGNFIGDTAHFAAQGVTENPEQIRMALVAARYDALIQNAHNHNAMRTQTVAGAKVRQSPCVTGAEKFSESDAGQGWNTEAMANIGFGTSESQGAFLFDGVTANPRVLAPRMNVMGYWYTKADPSNNRYRDGVTMTAIPWRHVPVAVGADIPHGSALVEGASIPHTMLQQVGTTRYIGPSTLTHAAGVLSLVDALNPTPRPLQIGIVVDDADLAVPSWYSSVPDTLRRGDATPPGWVGSTAYDYLTVISNEAQDGPHSYWQGFNFDDDTEDGITEAASSDLAEPTFSATIGDSVAEGDLVWFTIPWAAHPNMKLEPVRSATLTIDVTASSSVRASYAPCNIYDSDWITQTPDESIDLEAGMLTTLTFAPTAISQKMQLGGPGQIGRANVTVTGDDVFTGATLAEVSESGWLIHPPTCDDGVQFTLEFRPNRLRRGTYSTTLRVTKDAVTADLAITISVGPQMYPALWRSGSRR